MVSQLSCGCGCGQYIILQLVEHILWVWSIHHFAVCRTHQEYFNIPCDCLMWYICSGGSFGNKTMMVFPYSSMAYMREITVSAVML